MKTPVFPLYSLLYYIVLLTSCGGNPGQKPRCEFESYHTSADTGIRTGGVRMVPIRTDKGKFNVWTKRIGNNPKAKVLILHGGPGGTHDGYECFESFLPKDGIEFIYYDQLDCGNSDRPGDTSLYELSRYVEEVEQVRLALNLNKDNFYLFGHSWGGLLAMQYALKYQSNIKCLIVSDMMSSCPAYAKYAEEVLAMQMPKEVLDTIKKLEEKGDFSNPKYMELLYPYFYKKHVLRMEQWPEPINRMFGKLNSVLYVAMQGPSEFGVSGKLTSWDISGRLREIDIPTLVIGATYDTMDPEHLKWMSKEIPKGEFLLCPNGSHCCFYDDQNVYFRGLIDFIKKTS